MNPIVSVEDLTFRYSGAAKDAVHNFNLSITEGEIVILAGPSGCGKSTLLRAINGLIPHMYSGEYSGDVYVDGVRVRNTPMKELAQKIGFLFQNPENQIFMFSVERDIAFGLENLGVKSEEIRKRVDEAMAITGITHLAKRAPYELSDGQKQRVALAGVIAMRPKLIILDEPTSLLDPMTAFELVSLIGHLRKSTGITFLIVEHRLDLLVKIADRIVIMNDGKKMLDGKPSEVLFDDRASGYGVLVPTVARLQMELEKEDIRLSSRMIDVEELAKELNSIIK